MGQLRSAAAVAAACLALALPGRADHPDNGPIEPSPAEQAGIYELNRARNDPAAYGAAIGFDLSAVAARPPLAVNPNLQGGARFHADLMLDHHEYGHTSALLGIGPNQMAADNGYDLFGNGTGFSWGTANTIESILRSVNQVSSTTAAVKVLVIDKDVPGAGHRVHLMGAHPQYEAHREIGFGWAAGVDSFPEFGLPRPLPTKLCAIHTAHRDPADRFLTGVVYRDANRNGRYDAGEGMGGVTVSTPGYFATSMAAGGWSLKIPPGDYLLACEGGGFPGRALAFARVGPSNVEVDFRSGAAAGEVDFAWRDGVPAGPDVSIGASGDTGPAPFDVLLTASGAGDGLYEWDLGPRGTAEGATLDHSFTEPGLHPVILRGLDASGIGTALFLVTATDPAAEEDGRTPPDDGLLNVVKGVIRRKVKVAGRDRAILKATLELPAGQAAAGTEIQVCIAGVVRTFVLDAKGKAVDENGNKVVLKARWPKDGSGVPGGTVAKLLVKVKGDLAAPLEAAGLRDRTETRTLEGVPCAVLLGGMDYPGPADMTTKAVAGKAGRATLLPAAR